MINISFLSLTTLLACRFAISVPTGGDTPDGKGYERSAANTGTDLGNMLLIFENVFSRSMLDEMKKLDELQEKTRLAEQRSNELYKDPTPNSLPQPIRSDPTDLKWDADSGAGKDPAIDLEDYYNQSAKISKREHFYKTVLENLWKYV